MIPDTLAVVNYTTCSLIMRVLDQRCGDHTIKPTDDDCNELNSNIYLFIRSLQMSMDVVRDTTKHYFFTRYIPYVKVCKVVLSRI